MRIAYLNFRAPTAPDHPKHVNQGAEGYLAEIMSAFEAKGAEVFLIHHAHSDPPQKLTDNNIIAVEGRWPTILGSDEVSKALARWMPDLIHIVNPSHVGLQGIEFANHNSIPVVASVVDHWWACPKATLINEFEQRCIGSLAYNRCAVCIARTHNQASWQWLAKRLPTQAVAAVQSRIAARKIVGSAFEWENRRELVSDFVSRVDAWIALSSDTAQMIQSLGAKNCSIVPMGLADFWLRDQQSFTQRTDSDQLVIGYVGAIGYHKGVHILAEAMSRRPKGTAKLRLAGKYNDPKYAALIKKRCGDVEVEFCGTLGRLELKKFYRSIDLLVVPSLAPENRPQVISEARSQGVVVIGSDVPGVREIVDNDKVFRFGSVEALANKIQEFAMGNLTQDEGALPYSIATVIDAIEDIYIRVMDQ